LGAHSEIPRFRFLFERDARLPQPGCCRNFFKRNGITCEETAGTRDPALAARNPEPIEPHIAPLQQAVTTGKYRDAGLAADGDGDRIGAVDRAGRFVKSASDFFRCLCGNLRRMRDLPGDIAKTFSVTKLIDKTCSKTRAERYTSSDRVQIHLRVDARAGYSDRR